MIYYNDYGKGWEDEEDEKLNILYNVEMMDIVEISKKISRSPSVIVKRLIEKKYVENYDSARGYKEYVKSPEYIEYMRHLMAGLGGGTAYSN